MSRGGDCPWWQMLYLQAGGLKNVGSEVVTRSILDCSVMRLMTGFTTHVNDMAVGGHRISLAVDAARQHPSAVCVSVQLSTSVAR